VADTMAVIQIVCVRRRGPESVPPQAIPPPQNVGVRGRSVRGGRTSGCQMARGLPGRTAQVLTRRYRGTNEQRGYVVRHRQLHAY